MRKITWIATALALALTSGPIQAQGTGQGESNIPKTSTPVPPPNSGGGGTNQSARLGQASQMIGMGMNVVLGVENAAKCGSSVGSCGYCCVMAGLAFASAGIMAASARQSGRVVVASAPMPTWDNPDIPVVINDPRTWPADTPVPGGDVTDQTIAAFKKMEDLGYHIQPDGSFTLPDGTRLSAKDFKSEESLQAAGINGSDALKILSSLDQAGRDGAKVAEKLLGDAANVVAMGVDSSGGGGGGGSREPASWDAGDSSFDDYLARLRNPFGLSKNQKAQMVAGKTLTHGDDQIGVKVDDIFKMVHRRYQEKRAGNEFIETAPAQTSKAPIRGR